MPDRRQNDRRETDTTKKISLTTYILSLIAIVAILALTIYCILIGIKKYNKGYEDGYNAGYNDGYRAGYNQSDYKLSNTSLN